MQSKPASGWTCGERVLLVLCAPPVLLAVWAGAVHHNWHSGLGAIRYSVGGGPTEQRPLVLAGSVAGLILVLGVAVTGGAATVGDVMSQQWVWVLILVPETAWAGPLAVAWVLMPLRRPLCALAAASSAPDEVASEISSRGAFSNG